MTNPLAALKIWTTEFCALDMERPMMVKVQYLTLMVQIKFVSLFQNRCTIYLCTDFQNKF